MTNSRIRNIPLVRVGLISLGLGLALFAAVFAMNSRATWHPLAEDLPLVAGESARFEFSPKWNGMFDLQIEADDTMGEADRLRDLTDWKKPSELDLDWAVTRGDEVVAAGDAADFVYIEDGPGSFLARMRRILLRMPYGQNASHWRTLGLAGSVTSSRCVGRFEAVAGDQYTIRVTPKANYPVMTKHGATLVIRPDRRRWGANFATSGPMAYGALLALGLGGALVVLGESLRRLRG